MATRSAKEMAEAVSKACENADSLLMAAAVADYRPANPKTQKIKKENSLPTLKLERTDDILSIIKIQREQTGQPKVVVGFAAETQDLHTNAKAKLAAKGLDLIAANDVTAVDSGFDVDTNRVTLLWQDGKHQDLGLLSKSEVAEKIVEAAAELLNVE